MGRVWASVRREFRSAWALLPFAKGDFSRPWDTTVHAADASLSGMGVAALVAPSTMVKSVGSVSERWRFKGANACYLENVWCFGRGDRLL